MQTWVALFRGINVGGKNLLPMAPLRSDMKSLGFSSVQSYIQSGNVVFRSSSRSAKTLQKKIEQCVEKQNGFKPHVLLLSAAQLQVAIDANPFREEVNDPKSLHLFFLSAPAKHADESSLHAARSKTERFELIDRVLYLHAPDGIARSKLAAKAEKILGVPMTARNFRTVSKVADLIELTS